MKKITWITLTSSVTMLALFSAGCRPAADDAQEGQTNGTRGGSSSYGDTNPRNQTNDSEVSQSAPIHAKAVAQLNPTAGWRASGTVTFIPQADGTRIVAKLSGLPPGEHGFHIHEKGDCSAPDASSAGGHFNPTGAPHGGPDAEQHHVGDLGNIEADEMGRAEMDRVFSYIELSGDRSILGRAVIVHKGEDDLSSQPSGDAGPRLACGVIENQP